MSITGVIVTAASKFHQSELTYNRPPTLLPAIGKPLVVRVMDRLYRAGIRDFVVILGETEGEVATYLSNRWLPDANLQFTIKLETHSLSDVLASATHNLAQPIFLATYNSFTNLDFPGRMMELYDKYTPSLLVSGTTTPLSNNSTRQRYIPLPSREDIISNPIDAVHIEPNEGVSLEQVEIGEMAIAGEAFISFLTEQAVTLKNAQCLMEIFQQYWKADGRLQLTLAQWLLQVETDPGLNDLNRYLLNEQNGASLLSEIPHSATIHEPVYVDPRVSIGIGAHIGPHVYLERGCTVGHDAILENSIVLAGATVKPGEVVRNAIVSTRGIHHLRMG